MDNDSSSMIISTAPKNDIVVIHDHSSSSSPQTSDSNTINNCKKRSREEFSFQEVVIINDNKNKNDSINSTTASSFPKFKGVVPQQNGNWGAQIYANHQRVWLGTFKTASLAAMAYDSAAIKLRTGDLHRNFPWTAVTLQEPQFQSRYSAEAILTMIKDGSYHSKFHHFVRSQSTTTTATTTMAKEVIISSDPISDYARAGSDHHFATKLLFQKELTPSDVGKLNRLVIPKKFAVKYFPYISEENFIIDSDDVELVFYDKEMTPWRFRYCYWKSSQSYVFTRGWNRFVKDNKLKANDVVTFYSRDQITDNNIDNIRRSFCLIDVTHHSATAETTNRGFDSCNHKTVIGGQERKGLRLFGVDII